MSIQIPADSSHSSQKGGRKSNKSFMILSAFGILFVIDVHLGQPLSIFTQIFPYDSFFMPMFAFISGYFFKESTCHNWKNLAVFAAAKLRKLLLPYLGWVMFYNCLSGLLFQMGIWQIPALSLRDLIYNIVTSGVTSAFNSPAWFAPLLFAVSIAYPTLRLLLQRIWNDHLFLLLLIASGCAAIAISRTEYNVPLFYMLLKVPFFLQFYHIGHYFRKYWEVKFDRLNAITVCLCAVCINMALISRYGNTIAFPICSSMSGFQSGNLLLPLITSFTGTAFWLKISKMLVPVLGHNRFVNYISENTFFIMTHHIGVKHLFIWVCLMGYRMGFSVFSGIDVPQFLSDGLYLFSAHAWCAPVCYVFSIVVLVIGCKIFDCWKYFCCSAIAKKQP